MRVSRRTLTSIAVLAAAGLALSGCSKAAAPGATTSAKTTGTLNIGVVVTGISLYPYYQAEVAGIKAAAAKEGTKVKLTVLDSQASDETEQTNMQQVINQKVDAIIYTPGSDAVGNSQTALAKQAGIPVIAVDRKAGDAESAYIGYDNVKLGEAMATYAASQLPKGGQIGGEIGVPGVINVINREKGWKNVLAAHSDIDYVGEVTTNFDPSVAYTVTKNLLTGHPKTQWILVMDDNTALGTIRAVKDQNSSAKVVGLGAQTAGLKAVKDGSMAATVLMKPYELGYQGLETAVKVVRGETFDANPSFDLPVVTKANVDDYLGKTGVGW